LFEFPATKQNLLKNQYLPQLSFENYEINSMKSNSPRAFQTTPRRPPNSNIVFNSNFHFSNGSIINSFHNVASNILKPSGCTPYSSRALRRYQEHSMKLHAVWEISA
jgi:hypothetical protein